MVGELPKPSEEFETSDEEKERLRSCLESGAVNSFARLMLSFCEKGEIASLERMWKDIIDSYDDEAFRQRLGEFMETVRSAAFITSKPVSLDLYQGLVERAERLMKPSEAEYDLDMDENEDTSRDFHAEVMASFPDLDERNRRSIELALMLTQTQHSGNVNGKLLANATKDILSKGFPVENAWFINEVVRRELKKDYLSILLLNRSVFIFQFDSLRKEPIKKLLETLVRDKIYLTNRYDFSYLFHSAIQGGYVSGETDFIRSYVEGYLLSTPDTSRVLNGLEFGLLRPEEQTNLMVGLARENASHALSAWYYVSRHDLWHEGSSLSAMHQLKEAGVDPFDKMDDLVLAQQLFSRKVFGVYGVIDKGQSVLKVYNFFEKLPEKDRCFALDTLYFESSLPLEDCLTQDFAQLIEHHRLEVQRLFDEDGDDVQDFEKLSPQEQRRISSIYCLMNSQGDPQNDVFFSYLQYVSGEVKESAAGWGQRDFRLNLFMRRFIKERFGLPRQALEAIREVGERTEHLRSHFFVMNELERFQKGAVRELYNRFGILAFGRYPLELLQRQYETRDDTSSPWGALVVARADHNGAFFNQIPYEAFGKLNTIPRIVEVDHQVGLARRFLAMEQRGYPKASYLSVNAHGEVDRVYFGWNTFEKEDGSPSMETFDRRHVLLKRQQSARTLGSMAPRRTFQERFLLPKAPVLLNSCSTGAKEGIAQEVSKDWKGHQVIGPEMPSAISHLSVSEHEGIVSVDQVEYRDENDNEMPTPAIYESGKPVINREM